VSRIAGVAAGLGLTVWLAGGCANQLQQVEVVEVETRSETLASRVVVETETPLRSARTALEVARVDEIEDLTERRVVRQVEVTPYSGWRELYEVPAGAVAVPLSLGFNAANAVLLGYVPDAQVAAFTSWTYAALNPALNVESAARIERRRGEVLSSEVERHRREQRVPLPDAEAGVQLDDGPVTVLRSDARGMLPFHLLELVDPGRDLRPRKLVVTLAPAGSYQLSAGSYELPAGSYELPVERDLAQRLRQARDALQAIALQRDDVRRLARAVFELDRLGFEDYSLSLEDEIAVQLHREPARLSEFSRELDRLYGAPLAELPPVSLEQRP
jgi:hypothetical protein